VSVGAVAAVAVAFFVAYVARGSFAIGGERWFVLADDAMISMRFARNLASGHGLVWNPGGPAIEGFSNLLWTLWMSALHQLPLPERLASLPVALSGIAVLLATGWTTGALARDIAGGSSRSFFHGFLLTVFCYPLVRWTLSGMETGLAALLFALHARALVRLSREFAASTLAGGILVQFLAIATRPDALVPLGAALLAAFALEGRRSLRWIVPLGVAAAVGLAALTSFRVAYFGDPLPNTYYLKMTGSPLYQRLWAGAQSTGAGIARDGWPLLALVAAVGWPWRSWRSAALVPAASAAFQWAYNLWAGGDAWDYQGEPSRFLAAASPMLIAVAAAGIASPSVGIRSSARGLGRCLAVLGIVLLLRGIAPRTGIVAGNPQAGEEGGIAWGSIVAAILCAVGAIALHRRDASRLPARIDGFQHRAPAIAATVVVVLCLMQWIAVGGRERDQMEDQTREALLLRLATREDARIAVSWAGALPYFVDRECIDVLGKCDPVIARRPAARDSFIPGHTKWDLAYSVGQLKPDVLAQRGYLSKDSFLAIVAPSYDAIDANGLFVLKGTPFVDPVLIRLDWLTPGVLEDALERGVQPST